MFRPQSTPRRLRPWRGRSTGFSSAGFSIVELIIVMAIMTMMAIVAVPWFVKISQRTQIKSAAQEIAIALTAARMKAVKRNAQVSFSVLTSSPSIEFQTVEPNPPAPTPTPAPQILRLPAKAARFKGPTPGPIVFGGDGRISAAATTFFDVEGPVGMATPNAIRISVGGNGVVKVITPVAWQ
jgi:Tfp pilus assembly protein FimT